jgi:PPOX class probable F420-dependent enzyme
VDIEEAQRRFAAAPVARLATADASGQPHLVPFTFGFESRAAGDGEGDGVGDLIYFAIDWKPKKTRKLKRLENIDANPAVSVLVDHYDADWNQLWWVRADGAARVLESGPEFDAAIIGLQRKYAQYRDLPPAGPVVLVTVSDWRSWAARG